MPTPLDQQRSPAGPLLVVLSATDPIAGQVSEAWGTPPASSWHVDGSPIRILRPDVLVLRRPGPHIHDERLDAQLPAELRAQRPTLAFPSVHRSESSVACLTVHPIGNPGPTAEVGGAPRCLVPTDPARMTGALLQLAEAGRALGLPVTFEATHHGPALELPAFFAEVATSASPSEQAAGAAAIARVLASGLAHDGRDLPVLGIGGGHYAPRFTDLARRRRWAFGHILSKYSTKELEPATAEQAVTMTPGAHGVLYARDGDPSLPALEARLPRVREGDAPRRAEGA